MTGASGRSGHPVIEFVNNADSVLESSVTFVGGSSIQQTDLIVPAPPHGSSVLGDVPSAMESGGYGPIERGGRRRPGGAHVLARLRLQLAGSEPPVRCR
ncbi:hypothetical protein ACFQ1S_04620 [Kibdelosporangium lantanae]|uniref:Uncharacterized protein n=1 Tax=Kibdelosporangium lantanae TaxID=1497396 RepID=A0ABW3M2Z2_9PSEU